MKADINQVLDYLSKDLTTKISEYAKSLAIKEAQINSLKAENEKLQKRVEELSPEKETDENEEETQEKKE